MAITKRYTDDIMDDFTVTADQAQLIARLYYECKTFYNNHKNRYNLSGNFTYLQFFQEIMRFT